MFEQVEKFVIEEGSILAYIVKEKHKVNNLLWDKPYKRGVRGPNKMFVGLIRCGFR